MAASLAPFVWGSGGEALSMDENKRRRLLAEALIAKGIDTSPIQHPTQGLARIAQAIAGNIALGRIDAEEAAGREKGGNNLSSAISGVLGGTPAAPAAPAATAPKAEGPVNPSFATMQGVPQSSRFDDLFRSTSERYGLPADYLPRTAQIESGMNPNAKNPNSSAGGLYQFIDGTAAQYGLANRFDPEAATDAAGRLARDNAKHLASVLGRNPTSGELYLAHQQGAGGAAKLLANPDAPAEQVLGGAAFRLNGGAPGMTAGQFAQKWTGKFGGTVQSNPVQVAQAGADDTGSGAFLSARQEARDSAAPVMPAQAPQVAQATAPAAPAATVAPNNLARVAPLVKALQSPYLSAGQRAVGQAVLARVLSQEQKTPAQIEKENLDLEKTRLDIAKARREYSGPGYALDQRIKSAQATKSERELMGEGAMPLTEAERKAYGITSEQPAYKTRNGEIKFGPAASKTQVAIDQRQESEFGKETGKALAKRFNDLATEGDDAVKDVPLLDELRKLSGRIDTGGMAVIRGHLGKMGIKTDGVSDIEAFNTLVSRLTPQQRVPGSGATSDFDAKMFRDSLPTLMNTPEGNKMVLGTMEKLLANKIARGDIAMRVQAGELSPKDGLAELKKLQSEARMLSDAFKPSGKPATPAPGKPLRYNPNTGDFE